MKKLFLGLAVTAGSLAFAQETEKVSVEQIKVKEPVRFGIKGAATTNQFSEQKASINNQKLGFLAGAFVNIPLSKKFALQPEVLYSQMGAKSVISDTEVTAGTSTIRTKRDFTTSLNYISVPLMLQMKPADNFYIEAGPEFSYFLDGKNKGEQTIATTTAGNTVTQTQSASESINKDDIKKFNVGMGLGLGYYFTPNLGINARFVSSFTNIANNSDVANDDQKNINKNRGFQLGLNYKF